MILRESARFDCCGITKIEDFVDPHRDFEESTRLHHVAGHPLKRVDQVPVRLHHNRPGGASEVQNREGSRWTPSSARGGPRKLAPSLADVSMEHTFGSYRLGPRNRYGQIASVSHYIAPAWRA